MTPAIMAAIEACHKLSPNLLSSEIHAPDPSLEDPGVDHPISHEQIIAISKCLRKHEHSLGQALVTAGELPSYHLDDLLRGSKVYIEPSKPKPEPVRYPPVSADSVLNWLCTVFRIQSIDGTAPSRRGSASV